MSLWNCGSVWWNDCAWVKSTHCFHCDDTPRPAISAKNSDTPLRMARTWRPATAW